MFAPPFKGPEPWPFLLHLDTVSERWGFGTLTPQARIISTIFRDGPISVKHAMLASKLSYRGFYLALNTLLEGKVVEIFNSSKDRRMKIITLTRQFKIAYLAQSKMHEAMRDQAVAQASSSASS